MSANTCNFALLSTFNALYDVTWSFQYSLSGLADSTGGFCTFVYSASALTGGGSSTGLGYAPFTFNGSPLQPGVNGAIIGVGFDSTGNFAVRQNGMTTGTTTPQLSSISVRVGNNFTYLSSAPVPFKILETEERFKTLRFNLSNLGQTLSVHYKNFETNDYELIGNFDTGLLYTTDTYCRIGISFVTPISAENSAILKIKDFHFHGR